MTGGGPAKIPRRQSIAERPLQRRETVISYAAAPRPGVATLAAKMARIVWSYCTMKSICEMAVRPA